MSSVVRPSVFWMRCAASLLSRRSLRRRSVMVGVLMLDTTLMISSRRGTPSVTFFADTPAKWNVFSVICVAGSPIDWPATMPHTSPGFTCALRKRFSISAINQSNAFTVRRCSFISGLVASMERAKIEKRSFALSCDSGMPTCLLTTHRRSSSAFTSCKM